MENMVAHINENECKQFDGLLLNLLSTDNDVRSKAESAYDEIPSEKKILFLINYFGGTPTTDEVASFAAVLLRRVFYSEFDDSFGKLSSEMKEQIRNQLILAVQQDISPNLRRKICDAIAELARNFIDDDGNNHWPEFLKFLFDSAISQNILLKEAALLMFAAVPGIFGNLQPRYMGVIQQMLRQCLGEGNPQSVRFVAVKALTSFIVSNEKELNVYKHFTDCLSSILQILSMVIDKQDEELENLMKSIVELAEVCPNFFRPQLDSFFQLCFKVLSDESCPEECSHLALEVMVTFAENAPGMVRKLGMKTVDILVPYVLKMMVDIEDDENWNSADDDEDEDNDSNPVIGESSIDRLACGLGGKIILPLVMNNVSQMLSSTDWKQRHAALMAISAIGEGCMKQMEPILPHIVDGVLKFLSDPHFRVRYAACNALGQMATDFGPLFQKKFHEKVIPGLLNTLGDESSPRVQAHSGAALVNFFEECPKNILSAYLDSIVKRLESVLSVKFKELIEKGTKLVLEQLVVTLAAVADASEEKFISYYDTFMPCLKYIIKNGNTPEMKLLRGKTIECVSLIGLAVGREKFASDASEVMNLLLESQSDGSVMSDDDPQRSYMISAWARICKILGKDFEPYLPFVMGPVMKTASLKPEIAVLDSDDMKVVEEDDDWQFVSLGEQQNFGIKTSGLEEKATACQMLVCYAKELKEAFLPYVEEVVKLMVSMLKFYFHDGVRSAAGECMPYLLESAKIKGDAYITDMWRYILPELLQAIESEPESEVVCEFLYAFAKCIEVLGGNCLMQEHMNALIKVLDTKLKEHFERADKREEKRKDEDYDEVLEEALLEQNDDDVYLLSKIADVVHFLFATHKENFLPYFDMLLPHFVRLLQPNRPWADRQWGLCIFDDLIEHTSQSCSNYQQHFLQPMLTSLNDRAPEVRQAAAYGIGILGQFGGPAFAKVCADAVPILVQVISDPESRSPENLPATENAIAAVTKILAHNNSYLSVNEIIPLWLTWLPVWEDLDEAPCVYSFLCTLLEQNHSALLGKNNCNLSRIVMVIAEALVKDAIDLEEEVGKRIVNLLTALRANNEVFSACLIQLSPQQKEALCNALGLPIPAQ